MCSRTGEERWIALRLMMLRLRTMNRLQSTAIFTPVLLVPRIVVSRRYLVRMCALPFPSSPLLSSPLCSLLSSLARSFTRAPPRLACTADDPTRTAQHSAQHTSNPRAAHPPLPCPHIIGPPSVAVPPLFPPSPAAERSDSRSSGFHSSRAYASSGAKRIGQWIEDPWV